MAGYLQAHTHDDTSLFTRHLLRFHIINMDLNLSLGSLKKDDYRCDEKIMTVDGELPV